MIMVMFLEFCITKTVILVGNKRRAKFNGTVGGKYDSRGGTPFLPLKRMSESCCIVHGLFVYCIISLVCPVMITSCLYQVIL